MDNPPSYEETISLKEEIEKYIKNNVTKYNYEILDEFNTSWKKCQDENLYKDDIIKILDIVKNRYNSKEFKNKLNLDFNCEVQQLDKYGNVYGFIFNSKYQGYPIVPVHVYTDTNHFIISIDFLSAFNYYNNDESCKSLYILISFGENVK